jgi:hypothetical protein
LTRYTIDRFEGVEWAVLQDERARTFSVPRSWLPSRAREGDVLRTATATENDASGSVHFELDLQAREERARHAKTIRNDLSRAPKGDLAL